MQTNNYTFMIDFQVSVLANDLESAMDMINRKYFVNNAGVWNFSNTPDDKVRITPSSQTLQLMDELGESYE